MNENTGSRVGIRRCKFADNIASWGGGAAAVYDSEALLADCVFERNTVRGWGGVCQSLPSKSHPEMTQCL